ncbi:endonuclease NucS domain-containing protein [Candidatus Bipolaricaulota bacterium]
MSDQLQTGVAELREVLLQLRDGMEAHDLIIPSRDEVLGHFGKLLSPGRIKELTAEEFRSFLSFKNNKHWTGLTRSQEAICSDMQRLREALALLLDEREPIESRYTKALNMIPGLGKAIAGAVLLVVFPDKYGVWNNTSEAGLKRLSLWPHFERGTSPGEKYVQVNRVLHELAGLLDLDLWTLDALWWAMLDLEREETTGADDIVIATGEPQDSRFGLERHLHDFLRDNWDNTEFGAEWSLEIEEGEPDSGYEYPTAIGRIDLLAKHRTAPQYLVIELKRAQSSDDTVGQILRYMGWVEEELLQMGESVRGLIIAHSADEKLRYALRRVRDVEVKLYEVSFRLLDPTSEER